MVRRCVWSKNLENEEAKAHYRAVENTTTVGCNGRETKKQLKFSYIYAHQALTQGP